MQSFSPKAFVTRSEIIRFCCLCVSHCTQTIIPGCCYYDYFLKAHNHTFTLAPTSYFVGVRRIGAAVSRWLKSGVTVWLMQCAPHMCRFLAGNYNTFKDVEFRLLMCARVRGLWRIQRRTVWGWNRRCWWGKAQMKKAFLFTLAENWTRRFCIEILDEAVFWGRCLQTHLT